MIKNLFVIFFLVSISSAASCAVDSAAALAASDIAPAIALVFIINIIVIALAYMAGESFHQPQLTVFAKEQIYHLVFSAILVVAFGGIMSLSCVISDGFLNYSYGTLKSTTKIDSSCYIQGSTSLDFAVCYINKMNARAEAILKKYSRDSIQLQMDSAVMYSQTLPLAGGSTVGFTAFKKAYSMQYDMLMDTFLVPSLVSLKMQKLLISFVDKIALQILLPLAFFLRIFIPTREMGNFLLGITLGIYIILPMLYALNGAMYDFMFQNCQSYEKVVSDFVLQGCGTGYGFWDLAKLVPQAFFLPNLAIALFITFVSGIAKALRGMG